MTEICFNILQHPVSRRTREPVVIDLEDSDVGIETITIQPDEGKRCPLLPGALSLLSLSPSSLCPPFSLHVKSDQRTSCCSGFPSTKGQTEYFAVEVYLFSMTIQMDRWAGTLGVYFFFFFYVSMQFSIWAFAPIQQLII